MRLTKSLAFKIRITAEAQSAITQQISYIVRRGNPENALRWQSHIMTTIRTLNEFPERFPIVDGRAYTGRSLRRFSVDSMNIYYEVDQDKKLVTILLVIPAALDI
ncbi:MAG: type II toxin-antitoxin system RelE/ParE family toxin [Fimbriimonadaceae bacterium]